MGAQVVQVRDVPEGVVEELKRRAEMRGQSFAAYLRDILAEEAATPPVEELMDRIATRTPINYNIDDVRAFMEDGRR